MIELLNRIENENATVVRLTTTVWKDRKGAYCKQSITALKRKCTGFNLVTDDEGECDVFWKRITNLNECKDGIYTLVTVNHQRDWESGHIEDWDYKLEPYNPPSEADK